MSNSLLLISILLIAAVTALLRFLPLMIFGKREIPPFLSYLGKVLPSAVMAMLVVYCLRGVSFSDLSGFLPQLIAGAVVVGSYVWKRNTLMSIIAGTVCYMLLVQLVF